MLTRATTLVDETVHIFIFLLVVIKCNKGVRLLFFAVFALEFKNLVYYFSIQSNLPPKQCKTFSVLPGHLCVPCAFVIVIISHWGIYGF